LAALQPPIRPEAVSLRLGPGAAPSNTPTPSPKAGIGEVPLPSLPMLSPFRERPSTGSRRARGRLGRSPAPLRAQPARSHNPHRRSHRPRPQGLWPPKRRVKPVAWKKWGFGWMGLLCRRLPRPAVPEEILRGQAPTEYLLQGRHLLPAVVESPRHLY